MANAQRMINVIRQAVGQEVSNGAEIEYISAYIGSIAGGAYHVSAYLNGDSEESFYVRTWAGSYLKSGDYVVVGVSDDGDSWVEKVLPYSLYSRLAVDHSRGILYTGSGSALPVSSGEAGQALLSGGPSSSVTWGTPWTSLFTTTVWNGTSPTPAPIYTKIASGSFDSTYDIHFVECSVIRDNVFEQSSSAATLRWRMATRDTYPASPNPSYIFSISDIVNGPSASPIKHDDFVIVITSTSGPVTYEVYARYTLAWERWAIKPLVNWGTGFTNVAPVTFYSDQSLTTTLPVGTQWTPYYSLNKTATTLRAQYNITGGGTVTHSATGYLKNSQRFIVINTSKGSDSATSGYWEINIPTSGTITGAFGSNNATCTSDGVPMGAWDALYYILPYGSLHSSLQNNFRIIRWSNNPFQQIPDDWVLVALQHADSTHIVVANGMVLGAGESQTYGGDEPTLKAHIAAADPHTVYQKESEKGAANGYASLDASTLVPRAQLGINTPDSNTYLRGDGQWMTVSSGAPSFSGVRVRRTANQTIGTGADVAMNWATGYGAEDFDTDAYHDMSTNATRLTAPRSGYYLITGNIIYAADNAGQRWAIIRHQGTTDIASIKVASAAGGVQTGVPIATMFYLTSGQYVELYARQNSGSNVDAVAGYDTFFSMVQINGAEGPVGPGVPVGGTAAQVLSKIDGTDYNTQWTTLSIPAASGTVASETSFGVAANAGSASTFSKGDHTHGTPTNPVTAHEGAADPHTGYLKESDVSGFATPALSLGTTNAAGTGTTAIRSGATVAVFDATAPSTQAIGDAADVGAAAFAARRDHKHAMPAFGSPSSQGMADAPSNGVATTIARSDHKHGMPSFGTPTTLAVGDTTTEGVQTTVARSDHRHGFASFGSVTSQTTHGASATSGVATTLARSDHAHGTPAAEVTYAAPAFTLGTSNAAGGAGTLVRSDATIAMFDVTVPTSIAMGDTAAAGSAAVAARRDHRHAVPAYGTVTAQTSFGATSTGGVATTISRSDHAHGTPANPTTGSMDGNARVAVKKAGTGVGTRRGINLIEGSNVTLTVTDDAANEEVDITITAAGGSGGTPGTGTTTSAVGDTVSHGVSADYSRTDHKHAREAFGTVTAQTSFGASSGNGAAATLARSDHTHGTPANPTTGNMDGNARTAVSLNSTLIGTRRKINLLSSANVDIIATDDSGGEQVNVTFSSPDREICALASTTTQSVGSSTTLALMTWGSTSDIQDDYGLFSDASDNITIGTTGQYRISGCVRFANDANGSRRMMIRKNGSNWVGTQHNTVANYDSTLGVDFIETLTAGDVITLYAVQNSGISLNVDFKALSVEQIIG